MKTSGNENDKFLLEPGVYLKYGRLEGLLARTFGAKILRQDKNTTIRAYLFFGRYYIEEVSFERPEIFSPLEKKTGSGINSHDGDKDSSKSLSSPWSKPF